MNLAKKAQYILNDKGKRTHAVLPITVFEDILEDFNDIKEAKARKKEKKIPYEDMKKKLIKNGKL